MESITIDVAGEPVPKGRPRFSTHAGFVQTFTPAKTKKYEERVATAGKIAMAGRPLFEGPLYVKVYAYLPIPKSWPKYKQEMARSGQLLPASKPDFDNFAKTACDALNGVAYVDDAQITDNFTKKRYSDTPGLQIVIQPLEAHRANFKGGSATNATAPLQESFI